MSQTLTDQLDALTHEISELESRYHTVLCERIRSCPHEAVITPERYAYGNNQFHTCLQCGLEVPIGHTGIIDTPLLSFKHSDLVIATSKTVPHRLKLKPIHTDAIRYPRRFEYDFLVRLTQSMPWTADEILDADQGRNYVVKMTYASESDWLNRD